MMFVPVEFLKNGASQEPESALKHMYTQYLCKLGIFLYAGVVLCHCCVLSLEVTLLFKHFLLNALLLLPHLLMPTK